MGGACGDQHPFAGERTRLWRPHQFDHQGSDLDRLRHAADAGFVRLRHLAGIGSDHGDAVALELADVAAGSGTGPHQRVHRRRQQDRPVGGQQDGAGEVVGMAVRHLGYQVGGSRSHHDQVAVARQPDMAGIELALRVEQIGMAGLVRQRADGEWRHELLCGVGQHTAYVNVPLAEPPDQIQRLVGGDAAADDQGDAGHAGNGGRGRRGQRRGLSCGFGAMLRRVAQNHPDFVLDGTAVAGGAHPQLVPDGVIELSDGQTGHVGTGLRGNWMQRYQ